MTAIDIQTRLGELESARMLASLVGLVVRQAGQTRMSPWHGP